MALRSVKEKKSSLKRSLSRPVNYRSCKKLPLKYKTAINLDYVSIRFLNELYARQRSAGTRTKVRRGGVSSSSSGFAVMLPTRPLSRDNLRHLGADSSLSCGHCPVAANSAIGTRYPASIRNAALTHPGTDISEEGEKYRIAREEKNDDGDRHRRALLGTSRKK